MKLIGLDVGTKRIGVAKADSAVRIAVPYAAVEVDGTELDKIASLARAWDINSFVVGLPRNSQGQETEQSQYSRQFAAALKQAIPGAKVCFQDESLTSVEAEKRLKGRKKGYKKGDIDSEAATIILQDFLEKHAGKPTSKAAAAKHKSVKGKKPGKSHKLLTAFIVMLVLLGAAAGGAYYFYQDNLQPVFTDVDCSDTEDVSSNACKPVKFEVSEGMSVNDIAMNLKNAGLIRNSIVFQVFYRLNYSGTALRPGDYEFNKAMPPSEIIAQMIGGGDAVFRLTLLPGATVSDFSDTLVKLGYDQGDIEKALEKPYTGSYSWIFEGKPDDTGLEGYLYGETYEFYADDTVETIIEQILTEFASVLEQNGLKEKFAERGFNLYQGITLASVVQKEANNAVDYAKVAQVFYNRLGQDMNLGSDVTVSYAWDLLHPDRDGTEVSNAEKVELDSPYNTRKNPGLPYGPISNPGIEALIATATPDSEMANYLFFLTGDDGMMYYSTTDEEHQRNISEHCAELCSVAL